MKITLLFGALPLDTEKGNTTGDMEHVATMFKCFYPDRFN